MPLEFDRQNVLVTGAGAGIGRATAIAFAREGANVIVSDIREDVSNETAELILASGGQAKSVPADVGDARSVKRAAELWGPADVLINNAAAWANDGRLHEVEEEVWDRIVDVTLKSIYLCSRTLLPGMMERRRGAIINISSVNALTGMHLAAYTAAKGGILSLTRVMAVQYGPWNIRTNVICPGTIQSESTRRYYETHRESEAELLSLYPGGEFGEPEDIAECALYLASPRARFVNGSVFTVDGAMSSVHRLPTLLKNPED